MFDPPERVPYSSIPVSEIASAAHQELASQAARESIVLLKNQRNTLPLRRSTRRIAVIGPGADDPDTLLGNYNGIPPRLVTASCGHRAGVSR